MGDNLLPWVTWTAHLSPHSHLYACRQAASLILAAQEEKVLDFKVLLCRTLTSRSNVTALAFIAQCVELQASTLVRGGKQDLDPMQVLSFYGNSDLAFLTES